MRVGDDGGFCGGTLVASKYVITAAHCMFEYDERDWVVGVKTKTSVVVGEHDRWKQGETNIPTKRINVKRIINHPNYDGCQMTNDMSLLTNQP